MPHPLLSHYTRQSLNGIGHNGAGPSVMPTPPVATARKRKRANQDFTISYSEVQEVDSDGRLREVIVIDDTPPPTMSPTTTHTGAFSASYQPPLYSAPIRTRARAAAEAQALSASSSSAIVAPPPKKRKRDHLDQVRALPSKKAAPSNHQAHALATKSWDSRSAAATDDVRMVSFSSPSNINNFFVIYCFQTSKGPVSCDDKEGHYIIVPDDMIYRRCTLNYSSMPSCIHRYLSRSHGSTVGSRDLREGRRGH